MMTPWGKAERIYPVANGILYVKTKSHGGYQLSEERNGGIPTALRKADCFYEEDCEAAIVACFLGDDCFQEKKDMARQALNFWYPEAAKLHLPV